jgi:hypothetical protein
MASKVEKGVAMSQPQKSKENKTGGFINIFFMNFRLSNAGRFFLSEEQAAT